MRRKRRFEWCDDYSLLATYNSEVARGIVHTPEWQARMQAVQDRFNRQSAEFFNDSRYLNG